MDPLAQVAISAATVIVAAVVAIVVGGRKGLGDIEARVDAETNRLIAALEGRVKILDLELATARSEIVSLRAEVATLRSDLATEQRITRRLKQAP